MTIDFTRNHFELLGQPIAFGLDSNLLEKHYRSLQAEVHPDRHAHLPEAERRLSLQWATQVNTAFQTLKYPLTRARYLLQLQGIDTQEETNTAMPVGFLMEQMEWRENIADARQANDITALETLSRQLQLAMREHHAALEQQIDIQRDFQSAAVSVRQLKFLEKLDEEIGNAIEAILG